MVEQNKTSLSIGGSADLNRKLIENKNTKALILDHHSNKKDSLYERDSGLNHILCKLAKQKNVSFIIDLHELDISDLKTKAEILGRIIQNIRLFRKFGNDFKAIAPKNSSQKDFASLLIVLGVPTNMLKKALQNH